jgi:hypothetical protein
MPARDIRLGQLPARAARDSCPQWLIVTAARYSSLRRLPATAACHGRLGQLPAVAACDSGLEICLRRHPPTADRDGRQERVLAPASVDPLLSQ